MSAPPDRSDLICVTGASGYIGTHVVRALIERGYRVRATVRDPSDAAKTAHLRSLGDRVEVVAGDLMTPGSFDDAVRHCRYVVHAASPVMLNADDPERDIIGPAVAGTHNVLEAVVRAGTVERVVQTSSVAAVYDLDRPESYRFTEADWNASADVASLPYPVSKTRAERAAVEFVAALPPAKQFALTAINPTFVLGPVTASVHLRTSPDLIFRLLRGQLPLIPDFFFNLVDVRDVASAHVRAMLLPRESLRSRYICFAEQLHLREICDMLRREFPDRRFPRWSMPNPLMYGYSIFDRRLTWSYLRRSLGRRVNIDNARIRTELGVAFRPMSETLVDTVRAMVDLGFVR